MSESDSNDQFTANLAGMSAFLHAVAQSVVESREKPSIPRGSVPSVFDLLLQKMMDAYELLEIPEEVRSFC